MATIPIRETIITATQPIQEEIQTTQEETADLEIRELTTTAKDLSSKVPRDQTATVVSETVPTVPRTHKIPHQLHRKTTQQDPAEDSENNHSK